MSLAVHQDQIFHLMDQFTLVQEKGIKCEKTKTNLLDLLVLWIKADVGKMLLF